MKYWEFLIQKEGDQTWLPLETQQVEILEGRYRVVAHTDRVNTSMEVQVSQLITDELPPRKRVRKRTSRTNESGLVVVVPYVHLKPGQWELICSSDAIDSLVGDGWQYSVQLQVFAHTEEDWSAEWPVPSDSETAASMIVDDETDLEPDFRPDSPLVQAQAELESRLQEERSRQNGHQLFAASEGPADERYQVVLRQQAFLAQHNLPMTIVGKVNALAEALQDDTSQLWIRLQNPETAQVIMEAHRPLSLARLPADFKVQIQLPTDVTTRVILGEVSLRSPAIDPGDTVKILASTAFTITAGIAQLLDAIANQAADMFTGIVEEDVATAALTPEPAQVSLFPQSAPKPAIAIPLLDPTQPGTQPGTMPAVGVVVPSHPDEALDTGVQPQLPSFVEPSKRANLIVSDGPSHSTAVDTEDLAATAADANAVNNDMTAQMPSATDLSVAEPPVAEPPTPEPPAAVPIDRIIQQVPVVSQPAQFLGTSIEDSDLEADEIAAVLEDIDQDLRSEESDLDALEPPGIEGALPSQSNTYSARRSPAPTTRQTAPQPPSRSASTGDSLFADEAAPRSRQSSASKSANGSPASGKFDSAKLPTQRAETNVDFQSLRLKDHFWDRLSSLTHDSHREATQLAKSMREAGVSRDRSSLPTAPAFAYDNEVVIYDEPAPSSAAPASSIPTPSTPAPSTPTPAFRSGESLADRLSRGPAAKPTPAQVANSEELPDMVLPVISVPMGDLVAGEMISVTVRTRPSVYKPFIKLWMIDRQSRSLVIEPQLLTSLKPDALGDLEATTELRVPMDCLDVQIAAIAVDMATQQESNKAIVNRHVVPSVRPATRGFSF